MRCRYNHSYVANDNVLYHAQKWPTGMFFAGPA